MNPKNSDTKYYDGTKLLSLMDIKGEKPEIYVCTTNRTGGKTTYFNRLLLNRFIKNKEKFILLYRYNYELTDCADRFFKDINVLFFHEGKMSSKSRMKGVFHELFYNEESCGYAITLNSADQIKKLSHFFSDAQCILFDEFQSENNKYCPNELQKFISIHTSVARGNGEQTRYVPVYMLSNPVSIINPYYTAMGIGARLREDTKFLRGDGFVMEQGHIESASQALLSSGFNRVFAKEKYVAYAAQSVYLNDNKSFIENMTGNSRYLMTLRYKSKEYAIKEYTEQGLMYIDDKPDYSFPTRITVTTDDHEINYVMLRHNDMQLANLRYFFERGCFRFKNLECKEVLLSALSY